MRAAVLRRSSTLIPYGSTMPSISIPTAILGVGALGVAGSVGSSLIGANAASKAAQAQENAANTAANTQLNIYNQTKESLAPYLNTGTSALQQLASLFGIGPGGTGVPNSALATSALTQFPGYTFGLQQGQQALDRSAAASGLLLSGGQLKAAQQFGQGYALQNAWAPYVNQLSGLASLGENAGAITGNQGVATGAGVASSQLAAGQAAASGIVGVGNALTSGLQGTINSSLLSYALQNPSLAGGANPYNFSQLSAPSLIGSGEYVGPYGYNPVGE